MVYTELDDESQLTLVNQLDQGAIYCGEKMEVKITPTAQADLKTPVALISGRMTASAGEGVAMAFKGREKCIFLGEESYGLLTGNGMYELAFDVKMAMTTCYLADRNHVYRKSIIPDVSYIKQDNFEDPMRDPNIIKAVEFFNSHRKK
ncbi:MAG: S41 family peptidase [Bacteroidota bacterium]